MIKLLPILKEIRIDTTPLQLGKLYRISGVIWQYSGRTNRGDIVHTQTFRKDEGGGEIFLSDEEVDKWVRDKKMIKLQTNYYK